MVGSSGRRMKRACKVGALRSDFNRAMRFALRGKVLDTQPDDRLPYDMALAPKRRDSKPRDSNVRDGASREPLAMHERAEADLAFVRNAMERSAYFSAVPGVAGVGMGVSALVAALVASQQLSPNRWLAVWLVEALIAGSVGAIGILRKARRRGVPLDVGPARRFMLGLVPAIVSGGALTVACVQRDAFTLLPAVWLLCYGIAVLSAGAVSVARAVRILGAVFIVAGIACIASPSSWGDWYLAAAFGLGHCIAGVHIARHYGG